MAPDGSTERLGLLAGGGALPLLLRQAWLARRGSVFVVAYKGFAATDVVAGVDHVWLDIAEVGAAIGALHGAGCPSVVLGGTVRRSSWEALAADTRGARLLPVLRRVAGDDGLLRVVIAELEGEGFRVLRPDEVIANLAAPAGVLGRRAPSVADWRDIRVAGDAARDVGAADRGQAAVARAGRVAGVEDAAGTDALLARCAQGGVEGGVLVKRVKPDQERRADQPAIGVRTVEGAAAARLHGIAVDAGGTLILDRDSVVGAADRLGLFVYGATSGEWGSPR